MDINELSELSLDYEEYIRLKSDKNVILTPVGTLPGNYSQQNSEFGLPIAVMDYQFNVVSSYRREANIQSENRLDGHSSGPISDDLNKDLDGLSETGGTDSNDLSEPKNESPYKVVYEDLTLNHGYFVKQGSKYGCDFLVYEKDPSKCHSFALVQILRDENGSKNSHGYGSKLDMQELVLWVRVANKVNKMLIIALLLDNNEVKYVNIDNCINNLKVIK
ncbi:tRNA intron endonuclease [Cryptosporidium ryanae]|uniref:tRNA intron endonuclease n=1 Tax=Cryptosporidium ryanae TaxID=515981 RepID=UPI00351A0399|nr:tRNA intron endonuclease [Cryptosporidium ryanae]